MRVLARVMGLSIMFILTSIIFIQLSSFNIHEMELSDATTTAMTSTQIVEQENIEDDIYDTTNARKVIDSNTKYQQQYVDDFAMLVGAKSTSVTTQDGETSATLYAGLRNKHDLNTLPNAMSYTNQTAELTENVAKNTVGGTRSTYKITFMETDWETGILSVKVQSTYAMLNGEYKTIETYKTNIIENNGVDTIKRFNIFFNANGGVCNESVRSVQKWKKYGELPIPQRNHYTFLGWYTELNGGTKVDANTIMGNGDVTLYAHWEANPFKNTIKHYVMDGDKKFYLFDTTNYTRRYEEKYQLSASEQGLTVPKGLALNTYGTTHVTGSAKEYPFGTQVTQKAEDMEYEFYYKTIDYKVTYNLNGGTNANGNKSSYNVLHGFNLETPTKRGYTFLGWYDENGQRVTTLNGSIDNDFKNKDDMYNKLNTRTVGNKVLKARWKANEYTITYDGNGATSGSMSGNVATYDSAYAIQENQYVRKGYTFIGWTTKADGTSDGYDWTSYTKDAQWNGDGFSDKLTNYNVSYWSGTWKFIDGQYGIQNGKIQLYAMWQINQYKINLNSILDGEESYWSHAYGTVDIYVNGKITRDDVSDAGVTLNYGDTWELKDIKATKGHYYVKTTYSEYGVNGKKVGTSGTIGEHGISLFPEWNTKVLGIHYHRNYSSSDTTTANQSVQYGVDGQKLDANPWGRTGYAFLGWSTDKNATKAEYSNKQSISNDWIDTKYPNIHLYAVWKPYTLTVRYHNDGAQKWISHANGDVEIDVEGKDVVETETVKYDEDYVHSEYGLLDVNRFTRNGYHDNGNWKIGSKTSTNKVKDASDTLPNSKGQGLATYLGVINAFEEGDVTVDLYPELIANTYTVKYNGNGENSGTTPSSSHTYDTAKNLTANGYVKNGYQFVGWNTQANGSGTSYSDKQSVKNLTATNGGTVTLYAQWKPYTLTIRYHGDGALKDGSTNVSGKDVLLEEKVAYNGSYTHLKDATKLSKDGYTPNNGNWIVGENGSTVVSSSKSLANGETVGIYLGCINSFHKSNVTVDLYPEWIANTWTVKYDANGGNGSMENTTHVWNGGIKVRKNTFEKPLYTFRGWNLSRVNNGKTEWLYAKSDNSWTGADSWYESGKQPSGYVKYKLADEQVLQACTLIKNDVITAHAQWTPNTYYVTYDANGGSGAPAQQAFVADSGTKLSTTKPTRTGYTFVNWVYEGTTFNPGDAIPTRWGSFTLKAQWSPYVHTVTYNANGGSGAPENQTKTYGVTMNISSKKPTRFGYTFTGWKDSRTGKIWQPGENYTPDYNGGTNTLTAQWKEAVSYLESGSEFNKHIPSTTTVVEFTDEKAPSGVALTDVSNAKDESVVAWTVPNTTTWKVSSQIPNRKIYFNENCNGMFERNNRDITKINFYNTDTSKVTSMYNMFRQCVANSIENYENWNTENVTTMEGMFKDMPNLQILDLSKWNTKNVQNFRWMFRNTHNLDNPKLGHLVTSKATVMSEMFAAAIGLNTIDVSGFDTSNVVSMNGLFNGDWRLTSIVGLESLDTSKVTNMSNMFGNCQNLEEINVSKFDTQCVTDMSSMFSNCKKVMLLDMSSWNTQKVKSMNSMFNGCNSINNLDISSFNTQNVTDMSHMFAYCNNLLELKTPVWNTSNVTSMGSMFYECQKLTSLDVSNWNTSNVTNMSCIFYGCYSVENLDVSKWNTSNVTNMQAMFSMCKKIRTLDLHNFNTSKVTDMAAMFHDTENLVEIKGLSDFDVSNVTAMNMLFQNATSIVDIDLSKWDTSKVTNMKNMFVSTFGLKTLNLGGTFSTENVTVDGMDNMFGNPYENIDTGNSQSYNGTNPIHLEKITLSNKFAWKNKNGYLHKPNRVYIDGADGKWYTKSNGNGYDPSGIPSNTAETYHAVKYTIIYNNIDDANMPADMPSFFFYGQDKDINLGNPTKSGCKFEGWYTSEDFSGDPITTISKDTRENINLYAKWKDNYVLETGQDFNKAIPSTNITKIEFTDEKAPDGVTTKDVSAAKDNGVVAWIDPNDSSLWKVSTQRSGKKIVFNENSSRMFYTRKNIFEFNYKNYKFTSINFNSLIDTSKTKDMSYMFSNCSSLASLDLSSFDTSNVTNMNNMFTNMTKFETVTLGEKFAFVGTNGYLPTPSSRYISHADGKWYNRSTEVAYSPDKIPNNTSATYIGKNIFSTTLVSGQDFNKSIPNTNITKIEFTDEKAPDGVSITDVSTAKDTGVVAWIDPNDSTLWKVSTQRSGRKIIFNKDSSNMFKGGSRINILSIKFNNLIDTSKVTNMNKMFYYCTSLTSLDVTNFDTSNVTNMSSMFEGCCSLISLDVSNFDTSNVTDMSSMFNFSNMIGDTGLKTLNGIENFNTSKVANMSNMFEYCNSLTSLDVSNFDTSNVTDMGDMFNSCFKLTSLDVSKWNTSKVTNMNNLFFNLGVTSLDVSNFNTSNVTDMSGMFYSCESLTSLDVSNFDTSKVTDMNGMFGVGGYYGSNSNLKEIIGLSNFNTRNVTNMGDMFKGCNNLKFLDISNFDTSKVTNMDNMFFKCSKLTTINISNFNTSNVWNMRGMFYYCSSLTSLDVSKFNTSKVTDMSWMFTNTNKLTSLDVSKFNTSKVTNMSYMFDGCSSLTSLNVSKFNTSKVTDMSWMFDGCSSLTSLDVSGLNTYNVTNMARMFYYCQSLTSLDVSGFDTSKVEDMDSMFYACKSLKTLDLSNFNTSKTLYINDMFSECNSLISLDISSFDTNNVENMSRMFDTTEALSKIVLGPNYKSVHETCLFIKEFDNNYNRQWFRKEDRNTIYNKDNRIPDGQSGTYYKVNTITYNNINDANMPTDAISVYAYDDGIIELPTPTKDGLSFFGWYSDSNLTNKVESIDSSTKKDYQLYAKFGKNDPILESGPRFNDHIPETTTIIEFTDEKAPDGVTTTDVSAAQDKGVVAWTVPNTTTWKVSTQESGKKIIFNEYSREMFYTRHGSFAFSGKYFKFTSIDFNDLIDTSNVTDMRDMFSGCSYLTSLDVSNFDTSNVTDMVRIFESCSKLDRIDISSWDTSNTTRMDSLFGDCSSLTSLDVSNFDTSKVTHISYMFGGCSSLTSLDVTNFNTSNVVDMTGLFNGCSSLTSLDVSHFDTSNVTNMRGMFSNTHKLTSLDVSNFNTSNVTNMSDMFESFRTSNGLQEIKGIENFDTSKVTDMSGMFNNCGNLTSLNLNNFDTSNVTSMQNMFNNTGKLTSIDLSSFNTSNVTNMKYMFGSLYNANVLTEIKGIENFDTSKVTDLSYMFVGRDKLTSLDLSKWDVSKSVSFRDIFYDCNGLTNLDVSTWNLASANDMFLMFYNCNKLKTIDVSNFNPSKATEMYGVFYSCVNLQEIKGIENWNVSNVTSLELIFSGCSNITKLDLSNWNTSKVTNMVNMFTGMLSLEELNISNFDTTNVAEKNMDKMFGYMTYNESNGSWTFNAPIKLRKVTVGDKFEFKGTCVLPTPLPGYVPGATQVWYDKNDNYKAYKPNEIPSNHATTYVAVKDNLLPGEAFNATINLDCTAVVFTDEVAPEGVEAIDLTTDNSGKYVGWYEGTVYKISSQKSGQKVVWNEDCVNMLNGHYLRGSVEIRRSTIQYYDLSNVDTSQVTNMDAIFSGNPNMTEIKHLNNLDTSNVSNMRYMFNDDLKLTSVDLSSFNTSKVKNFQYMFLNSGLTSLDVSNFDTSNGNNMLGMFADTYKLKSIKGVEDLDVSNATTLNSFFHGCAFEGNNGKLDLSKWDTSNVTNMDEMFTNTNHITSLDISNFDTSKVTSMDGMFGHQEQSEDGTSFTFSHPVKLQEVTLGNKFAFVTNSEGKTGYLPNAALSGSIPNAAVNTWYDKNDNYRAYKPNEIPNNHATTYTVIGTVNYK